MANVLLITGAGRGIGAATAKLAAGRGYDVARQLQDRCEHRQPMWSPQ